LNYHALFFQDDWKVSRKLTVNLGLRWDKEDSPTDRFNAFSNFDPAIASPLKVPGLNLVGGLSYPGTNGRDRALLATSNKNFQPRLGFAYQLDAKTVLRGAYGISFVPGTQSDYGASAIGFSSVTSMVASTDGGRTPANTISNPFPQGLLKPTGSSLGALTGIGTALTGARFNIHRGYSQQWNFSVQHQPLPNLLVEAAYVGNRGVHLFMYNQQLNQLPETDVALGTALGQPVPNPFAGVITAGNLAAATIPRSQTLLPYPQFTNLPAYQGGVVNPFAFTGNSIYHAFTLKIEKRFSRGFSVLAAYSKTKLIDAGDNLTQVRPGAVTGTTVQDWNNLAAERSKSLYDVPQRLVITALWELPFGRTGNPIYRAIAGGWQWNGVATIQSGLPIPLLMPVTTLANRPSVMPGVSDRPAHQSLAQWFNTAAFTAPAPFTYGNVSRTLPDISSGTVKNLDFSLFKNFTYRETYKLQFRAEAFNLTNTPTFETPGNAYGTPTFGQVTATAFFPHPRVVQFGLRMQF
jgi:hypothetical protein